MIRFLIIFFFSATIFACNNSKRIHKYYSFPEDFSDTIKALTAELENCVNCNYVIFQEKYGNCFGPSQYAYAKVIWTVGEESFIRKLEVKKGQVIDETLEKSTKFIFSYFNENRIDTITKIPSGEIIMIPTSKIELKVKSNLLTFNRSFDRFSLFSSSDSLHPLVVFAKKIME
jgi:hypothetical protein